MFSSNGSAPPNGNTCTSKTGASEVNRTKIDVLNVSHIDSPNQPRKFKFPKRDNGRSFQPGWFDTYPWLHYNEENDVAFCFVCLKAAETKSLSVQSVIQGDAFTKTGFSNWRKALEEAKGFKKHQSSKGHREAVVRHEKAANNKSDVIDMISTKHAIQRSQNRQMLLKILTNIRYLGKFACFYVLIFVFDVFLLA